MNQVGDKVILDAKINPPFDLKAWRDRLREMSAAGFLPKGRPEQPPMPDDDLAFD